MHRDNLLIHYNIIKHLFSCQLYRFHEISIISQPVSAAYCPQCRDGSIYQNYYDNVDHHQLLLAIINM